MNADLLSSEEVSIIPETLLAFAKDDRYVGQCQSLLRETAEGLGLDITSTDGVAWLLYALLVVRRAGRTLGMSYMGLRPNRSRSLWLAMALGACGSIAVQHWMKTNQEGETAMEHLRGRARLSFHQEQRQAMIRRSQERPMVQPEQHCDSLTFVDRAKQLVKQYLREIASSTISSQGPHALPSTQVLSLGKWILRLQLAHFCVTGRFPSWLHRLLGVRIGKSEEYRSNLLANRPTTFHLAGMLIGLQASAMVLKKAAHLLSAALVARNPRNPRSTLEDHTGTSARTKTLTATVCGICGLPRTEPAAPRSCGHVSCWKCLQQWVSSTRPECPMCRSPCRAQDIIAFYNYSPS